MQRLVLASGNRGKLAEFQQLLHECAFDVVAQSALEIPDIEETGLSFVENAILKARNAAQYSGLPALADDSGLEVDALHGAPGIYSARYAGLPARGDTKSNDAANNQKLLDALTYVEKENRTARYQCVLVFMRHARDPSPLICQSSWEGEILTAPRGNQGFGYDPLFYIPALEKTAAELPPAQKNQLSHRGQAMRALLAALRERRFSA
ncbi:MAG: RdgB/HAM1 family non-canonical purine NTP pyrophosphatase [Spongiibacteraceae bacterium]